MPGRGTACAKKVLGWSAVGEQRRRRIGRGPLARALGCVKKSVLVLVLRPLGDGEGREGPGLHPELGAGCSGQNDLESAGKQVDRWCLRNVLEEEVAWAGWSQAQRGGRHLRPLL